MEETLRKESDYIGQVSFYNYRLAALSAPRLSLQAADKQSASYCEQSSKALLVKRVLKEASPQKTTT